MFYICRTTEYVGNGLVWWRPKSCGYTSYIEEAGKYTEEEAKEICDGVKDIAYSCEFIDNHKTAKKVIIDAQQVHYVDAHKFKDTNPGEE